MKQHIDKNLLEKINMLKTNNELLHDIVHDNFIVEACYKVVVKDITIYLPLSTSKYSTPPIVSDIGEELKKELKDLASILITVQGGN